MQKPNFFILGAPKCGTSSLAAWLGEHRDIFISSVKEPHFFNTDDRRVVNTLEHYESFFRDAGPQHMAVGEASVWYLSSRNAVTGILQYAPDARFIVMLRNPIEMAPALHAEMVFTGVENTQDFATAWSLQEERRQGRRLPALCWEPRRLQYGDACSLGAQLERLLSIVPRQRVLPIFLDDIRQDARREYVRVLEFLGIADDGRRDFPVHNVSKVLRWPLLPQLANAVLLVKTKLGITGGLGLWSRIEAGNRLEKSRDALSADMTATLKQYFEDDILRLGRLLNRDMQAWLT